MKTYFRNLIDKVVDTEGFVDIERTLIILPERIRDFKLFINNFNHKNIRVLIRGSMKYFFLNDIHNLINSLK